MFLWIRGRPCNRWKCHFKYSTNEQVLMDRFRNPLRKLDSQLPLRSAFAVRTPDWFHWCRLNVWAGQFLDLSEKDVDPIGSDTFHHWWFSQQPSFSLGIFQSTLVWTRGTWLLFWHTGTTAISHGVWKGYILGQNLRSKTQVTTLYL